MDSKTRITLKEKEKKFRTWIKSVSNLDRARHRIQYNKARNKVKSLVRKAKSMYEKRIANKSKLNPKPFWAYTKRKLKNSSGISPLLESITDPSSLKYQGINKSNILQKQFIIVFTDEPSGDLPDLTPKTNANLPSLTITPESVKDILNSINPTMSIAPYKLHPRMLKEISNNQLQFFSI